MQQHADGGIVVHPYVEKGGEFIRTYPPLGDAICDMYDAACSSKHNPWGISDYERNTREIQGVSSNGGTWAQEHAFSVAKNYRIKNAAAMWDVATGTGEIACAVLVPTLMSKHFVHAATALLARPHFNPKVMYSDTWPHGTEFWNELVPGMQGRLGLSERRIT